MSAQWGLGSFLRGRGRLPFQLLSDLHLELDQQYSHFDFPCSAPYLILAGDIGRLSADYEAYLAFLSTKCCNRFDRVFLILGNHEFFGSSHTEVIDTALKKLEQEPLLNGRLSLLYRRRFDVSDDVTILGCTLFSHIPDGEARAAVQSRVKDFQHIIDWTVEKHNAEHEADVHWLSSQIAQIRREEEERGTKAQPRRILVVTHHAPCVQGTSHPRHAENPWNSAFATDLLPLEAGGEDAAPLSDVQCWVFGHTHFTTNFDRAGIRIVSNQRGYVPGSKTHKGEATHGVVGRFLASLKLFGSSANVHDFCPDRVIYV